MKQELKQVRDYYKTCEIYDIPNFSWRYFTFKLRNGTFKRFHISNKEQLRKLLIKNLPIVAYYSQSCWSNPEDVRGKANKNYPIKIHSDVVFDIDDEDMNKARLSTIELIKRLGTPQYIIMTRRGFHCCYQKIVNKIELINKVKDIKNLDLKCSINELGVFSIPLTLNKAGKVNILISPHQLNSPINELQALQPQIYTPLDIMEGFVNSERNNDAVVNPQNLRNCVSKDSQSELNGENITLPNPKESPLLSFNNIVKSGKTKLFIPILIYDKSYKGLKNEIDKLNKQFNLGDILALESNKYYAFISLRCFEEQQLTKILNKSRSLNKRQQSKFNKTWLNISEFQLMGIIRYKITKFFRASLKHFNYFKDCGIKMNVDEFVGHPLLKIKEVHKK